jgi:CO/xanthine dehydrogenase Mo-binding subunit
MAESKFADPVGLPLDRVDGRPKVTGKAPYAYEYTSRGDALYGVRSQEVLGGCKHVNIVSERPHQTVHRDANGFVIVND